MERAICGDGPAESIGVGSLVEPSSPLSEALRRYQAGEAEPWTAVILEELDHRVNAAASLVRVDAVVSADDLRQQLRVELLTAAKSIRLDADRWLAKMLMERALRSVRRWARRQRRLECVPLLDGFLSVDATLDADLSGIAGWASAPDLGLLYRRHVLGEPWAVIAGSLGTTETAIRRRASRVAARIREAREAERRGPIVDNIPAEERVE